MNDNAGFGSAGIPYEYTVSEQKNLRLTFKRISLIALYALWAVGLLLIGARVKLILPLLALIPVTTWMLVFFTWRFTQVEYEYSFFSGEMTVCRVLGGRSRKQLAAIKIRDLAAVHVCADEASVDKIDAFNAEHVVFAASSTESPSLCAALWNDEETGTFALYFDCNEKAAKIIRYYNASAGDLRKLF